MATSTHQEDILLVRRCKKGDQRAYTYLLRKYQQGVYNLCYRLVSNTETAQDLAQESFVKVFNALDQYDPKYRFASWLYRVAKNHCYDYLRKVKLSQISLDEENKDGRPLQIPDFKPIPDQELYRQERARIINEAINKLPVDSRTVIVLRHLHDKSYEDIARILKEPVGTIKARIHRARKKLGELLNADLLNR